MTIHNQEAYLVLQIFALSVLAILIAAPLYAHLRKTSPELGWGFQGNIPTTHFTKIDILGVSLALLLFVSNLIAIPFIDPKFLEGNTSNAGGIVIVISGIITQMIPAGIAILFLVMRFKFLEIVGLKNANWKRIGITVLLGMLSIIILANLVGYIVDPLLEQLLGEKVHQEAVRMILEAKQNDPASLIGLAFLACIVAPICEEIVYRGYFYGVMKRYSCRYFAAISTGVIFAAVHASMWSLAPLIVVGIILAIVYELSGSLWAPIICHCIFNSMSTIYMIFFLDASTLPY